MATKGDIAILKKEIASEESVRGEYLVQIGELDKLLALDGGNEQYREFKREIEGFVGESDVKLGKLREKLAQLEDALPAEEKPKWDPTKHPLFKKITEKPEPEKPIVYQVGDIVEAKWEDRQWYKAKILSSLGSSANPKYTVGFVDYKDSHLTVDRSQIRPLLNEGKKRKADGAVVTPSAAATTIKAPAVISAAASINVAEPKQEPSKVSDGPPRPQKVPRKIGTNGALNKKQKSWKEFMARGGGDKKAHKKDSMFRSGDSVGSKVGVTGSGAGMRKDQARKRHIFKPDEEEEEEVASLG
ncbi:hypothetical protein K469DRAFT_712293 [Zopfia rhizophila CBS 207.26]|uniref:Tudor domain-containing protein n=1 Tax=Zopfia rhizophila CBS 207.26 TaxID=1314779 RepID=A0A6A6EQS2_9PEZI|nr:hypothetical protein K469DRAFT_712293 [Zopfia rhizophila CBS 207.26]